MNKAQLKNIILSHRKISWLLIYISNVLNIKNKIRIRKGYHLDIGVDLLSGLNIKVNGKNNYIVFKDFDRLKNCKIVIKGNNNTIYIDDDVSLNSVEFHIEDDNNEIVIGKHTKICGRTHLAAIEGTKILIGENCLFSSELHFQTGDSHSILIDGKRVNASKDIIIGNHVWIGTRVTCLKGVRVPDNSIVAATTTLCRSFEQSNCIIGVVPGKIIKNEVDWDSLRL